MPSEISYSLVIKGLSIQKQFDQALDFQAEMRHKNLEPNLDSCYTLVHCLYDNGRTDDAKKVLGEMLHCGPGPTGDMYNCVIDKYYTQNNLNKASELLHEIQKVGYAPHFQTYWSLISNLSCCDKKMMMMIMTRVSCLVFFLEMVFRQRIMRIKFFQS